MNDVNLNRLLAILDEYEISLDIDSEELALLDDELVNCLEKHIHNKSDIIGVLILNIKNLREKMNEIHTKEQHFNYNIPNVRRTTIEHPIEYRTRQPFNESLKKR